MHWTEWILAYGPNSSRPANQQPTFQSAGRVISRLELSNFDIDVHRSSLKKCISETFINERFV